MWGDASLKSYLEGPFQGDAQYAWLWLNYAGEIAAALKVTSRYEYTTICQNEAKELCYQT